MSTPTNPTAPMTAEAARAPQTGSAQPASSNAPRPAAPPAAIIGGVNKAMAVKAPVPAGLSVRSTVDIMAPWMRGCLYGETDAWKSTTAARFGSPDDVRIILTRQESQLLPIRDLGYKYAHCNDIVKFRYAMQYPEQLFGPEWAARENRVVVVDDVTAAKDMIVESNETDEAGKELRDNRMVHREAKADMSLLVGSLQAKPLHIIFIALAKIYENKFTHQETVSPDLPPAMLNQLSADWDFIFFSDKIKKMLLTRNKVETYQSKNEKGKVESYTRTIFAKNKLPLSQKDSLAEYEQHDLGVIWKKIVATKAVGK